MDKKKLKVRATSFKQLEMLPLADIAELKEWTARQIDLPNDFPDSFLRLFLHCCYYDLEQSKKALSAYYAFRVRNPQWFSDRDPHSSALKKASKFCYFGQLPGFTEEGYKVITVNFVNSNSVDMDEFIFANVAKLGLMVLDAIVSENQLIAGYALLMDGSTISCEHLNGMSSEMQRSILNYFQEACPIRIKKIVVLNNSTSMNVIIASLRPFMCPNVLDVMEKYNTGEDSYFMESIPRRMLPREYGGQYKELKEINEDTMKLLKSRKAHFVEEDNILKSLAMKWSSRGHLNGIS